MQQDRHWSMALLRIGSRVLLLLVVLTLIAVGFKYVSNQKNEVKISSMERTILDMQAAMNVDAVRQYNIQKVIAIIDQYNVKMPMYQKYEIAEEIFEMSKKYPNLNIDLICATITHETGGTWNPEAVSPAGALGLMQIMPTTGLFISSYEQVTWTTPEEVLFNPITNIRIGSRYLSALIDLYDVDGGLAAYNGGERRAARWIRGGKEYGILPRETQEYIPAIQRLYQEYQDFNL